MKARHWILAAAGMLLIALPWLLPSAVVSRAAKTYPIQVLMLAWGISTFIGVILLFAPFIHAMRAEGRAYFAGRPSRGLAGKTWGPLAPSVGVPIGLLFAPIAILIGYRAGLHPIGLSIMGVLGVTILAVYIRSSRGLRMQRMRLSARVDAAGNQIVTSGEALTLVSTVMRVPQQKIYASDRFGEDVGSLHLFDDILDRLGGRLVLLKKKSGCDLSIEHIRTVGGFVEAWEDCLTRSKANGAH